MTGEEMERAIEFLLKNQAAFDARQTALEEQTNRQIRELAEGQQQTKEFLNELSQIVAQNSQQISHVSVVLANVVEVQNRNNEEIDALIKLVGGLIEGRGNGKSGS